MSCEHEWKEFISDWWYFCTRRCDKCNTVEGYGPWVKRKKFAYDPFMGPPPKLDSIIKAEGEK